MTLLSRRNFVAAAALLSATVASLPLARAADAASNPTNPAVPLHWLEGAPAATAAGGAWGIPWPKGRYQPGTTFAVKTNSGSDVPVQSWPMAYWPDGSLKWTAHAIPAGTALTEGLSVVAGQTTTAPANPIRVNETADAVEVDTGIIRCVIPKHGSSVFTSISRDGREIAQNGRLVALSQDQPEVAESGTVSQQSFTSEINAVTVERNGPVRAVVKVTGMHNGSGRSWLPFTVRLYFDAGADSVRLMHTFVFDGDEKKDFIRGLGVRFSVPMRDTVEDRHVRFVGDGEGLWGEAVRTLTGLRREPGNAAKQAQVDGRKTPAAETLPENVRSRLQYIPTWGDFSLFQSASNAYTLRKRTKPGQGWIDVDQGQRAGGTGYIGGATGGGVVFGLRDFWQRHPTELDIRGAATDAAEVTLWMWSPSAPAMDLRFYHDGMGQDTYEKQTRGGMEITYEDYEKDWGSATGIARTSEITLWAVAATPAREEIVKLADIVRTPPQLAATPEYLVTTKVFGGLWSLPDRSTPAKVAIEDRLDWQFDFYKRQQEQRRWYGFWNYGDVMHTYDASRHVWRYDVGGFAWDNSELSTDLWLWYAFMRSGRADIFRFAEAMTRHTGEVDVFHLGRFKGLGTRHGVQHWGDSAKQARISTAENRRFYYYLRADERIGDTMRELLDADRLLNGVDPVRKIPGQADKGQYPARLSVGTDWTSLAAAWLTEWERNGDPKYRDKLLTGMRDIGAATHGFFSGDRFGYDPDTGHLYNIMGNGGKDVSASHLNAVFGALEVCAELIYVTEGNPDYAPFEKAWLQYCRLYNAPAAEIQQELGAPLRGLSLTQGHSRLTAYAAWKLNNPALATRAWKEFDQNFAKPDLVLHRLMGPLVLNPVDEAAWVSTNDAAQWGLAAIQDLALVGNALPK